LKLSQATKLETTTVTEEIESPHPYENGANVEHKVIIEGATKYKLIFDPQCHSEETYDYLDMFTDEAKENKHARWEGSNWPTEPQEIEAEGLYFNFVSDDSTNYWGYKITIET
jgi:hypothetical protein